MNVVMDAAPKIQRGAGFADPVFDSQFVFRQALDVMARPGEIAALSYRAPEPPEALSAAAWALLLTLCDHDTSVWLDDRLRRGDAADMLGFHCGAPLAVRTENASFAVIAQGSEAPLFDFSAGTDEEPEQATTLIIEVETLGEGEAFCFSGPGVQTTKTLMMSGVPDGFKEILIANHRKFPCGVDWFFTCGDRFAAVPRSAKLEG